MSNEPTTEAPERNFTTTFGYDDVEPVRHSSLEFYTALFTLAGIKVIKHWQLTNCYWPLTYVIERAQNPWWLFQTESGLIKIGRRKRVWAVVWTDTKIRAILTEDDTTKSPDLVHAWTEEKLLEYLKQLKTEMVAALDTTSERR